MNLAAILALYAGGPGSGCHGDLCGRPSLGLVAARYDAETKRHSLADGRALPSHLAGLRIPPAWKDVHVNPDKAGALWVQGRDAKGRVQSVYSPQHTESQALKKFARVQALEGRVLKVEEKNERNRRDPAKAENADALKLIQHTGIRPGSDKDTGAEKQAYGATTLLGKHVVRDEAGNVTGLHFTGKKGVDLNIPVTDGSVRAMLYQRATRAGEEGRLFNTNSSKLSDYTHSIGGQVKTKDFRTLLGTRIAKEEVAARGDCCTTAKEYKQATTAVAKVVAAKLGNTPAIALKSYINPHVFSAWRPDAIQQKAA